MFICCDEKAAGSTRWITNNVTQLGIYAFYKCPYQATRCEVLARAALCITRILLQQPFVSIAFQIIGQAYPFSLTDKIDYQQPQLCGIAYLIASIAKYQSHHPCRPPQVSERLSVLPMHVCCIKGSERPPPLILHDGTTW